MTPPCRASIRRESESRSAEGAGNIDRIARARAAAQQRLAARHGPAADDIASDLRSMEKVAARQDDCRALRPV